MRCRTSQFISNRSAIAVLTPTTASVMEQEIRENTGIDWGSNMNSSPVDRTVASGENRNKKISGDESIGIRIAQVRT